MIVLKFGGTSVGTARSLRNVRDIALALEEPAIIVVSALGGLTDQLISTAHKAASGADCSQEMQAIARRHHDLVAEVVLPDNREEVLATIDPMLDELGRLYEGLALIGSLPARTLDIIVSFGERMSAPIVAGMIPGARRHYSPDFIKTEKWFGRDIADSALTNALIRQEFERTGVSLEVTGGFISADRDSGEITNLGRGGSDYTAALIAAALDAHLLDIWTDVDGFMTSDPRIIPDAHVIPEMSFVESMELCSFGAKVIYPPTIYPVFHKNIPIRILNTFNPSAPGTFISDKPTAAVEPAVTGLSALRDTNMVCVSGPMTDNVASVTSRAYNCMARHGIQVYLLAQPEVDGLRQGFYFSVSEKDAQDAVRALNEEFAPELLAGTLHSINTLDNLATVAIVGHDLRSIKGLPARIVNTLVRKGIVVVGISEGTSDSTITVTVERGQADNVLRIIHSHLFSKSES